MAILTRADVRRVFHYDPETGVLTSRIRRSQACLAGEVVGRTHHSGYRVVKFKGKMYQAHRLIWLYVTGVWPADKVDHVNGVRGDNRWVNLRECTNAENMQNKGLYRSSTSGLTGASKCRGKWRARVVIEGSCHHVGVFDSAEEAHAAYVAAKKRVHIFQPTLRGTL